MIAPGETTSARRDAGRDVAIVGMACTFPKARNVRAFWNNIVRGVDAIAEVHPKRWDPAVFYDATPGIEDKVYCKRGGYLENGFAFNPLRYGTMPKAVEGAEPDQFLVLRCAHEALEDAGCHDRVLEGERAAFILGRGNYLGVGLTGLLQRGMMAEQTIQVLRQLHPEIPEDELENLRQAMRAHVPSFGAEQAPGLIPNISSGRVANRFGLMGPNFTVDAACASSLIATDIAVSGLGAGRHDLVLIGGVHVFSDVPFLQVFSAMGALSRGSVIRPFDQDCDGTMAGEGVGVLVLKRLEDAERDGNRIYAVIKGVGTSSDGRAKSVTAPRVEGEELALRRAYEAAGVDPTTVGLIEAHGTGTPVGDEAEIEALQRVFGPRAGGRPTVALGSIKSMIGHTMPAAGSAGLIKTALSLYHKLLPPTLHCRKPAEALLRSDSRLYVNSELRPWIHGGEDLPRRAGVNAFGFGGVNAHVVLEEYVGRARGRSQVSLGGSRSSVADLPEDSRPEGSRGLGPATQKISGESLHAEGFPRGRAIQLLHERESEVVVLTSASRQGLQGEIAALRKYVAAAKGVRLIDVAATLNARISSGDARFSTKDARIADVGARGGGDGVRLAVVASSLVDLDAKLARAEGKLAEADCRRINDSQGVYYLSETDVRGGKVAFLFPGEGAQYVNMLSDICVEFPEVRERFDAADRSVRSGDRSPPSSDIYPAPAFSDAERETAERRLWSIERAVEAVLTADGAMLTLLRELGVKADLIAGHSGGEWVATVAAGLFDVEEFIASMPRLDRMYRDLSADRSIPRMAMLAVGAGRAQVERWASEIRREVHIANDNCPHQVVVVTSEADAGPVVEDLRARKVFVERLPYDRGYHTPAFTYICGPLREFFASLAFRRAHTPLYSCATTRPYADEAGAVVEMLANTFATPLLFRQTVEAMYEAGARIFVEVGPRANLSGFVDDILRGRSHAMIPTNHHRRNGVTTFHHAVARLAALHVPLDFEYLYRHREARVLTMDAEKDGVIDPDAAPGTMQVTLCYPHLKLPEGYRLAPRADPARSVERSAAAPESPPESAPAGPSPDPEMEITAPSPEHPPSPANPGHAALMHGHLALMEQTLAAHEEVMRAYLGGNGFESASLLSRSVTVPSLDPKTACVGPAAVQGEADHSPRNGGAPIVSSTSAKFLAFSGRIVEHEPGTSITMIRDMDLSEDLYLLDHHFDPETSQWDRGRDTLNVVPMTVSVAMMAEVAALLLPGRKVVGVRGAQAGKWVDVEPSGPQVTLRIVARRENETGEVRAAIYRDDGSEGNGDPGRASPVAEATIALAETYPKITASQGETTAYSNFPPLVGERKPSHTARQVYDLHRMFHGPRFQGVVSLDAIGENGLTAQLEVLPVDDLFASNPAPRFHVDPFLLDAAGQLVGYWPVEYLNEGFVLFPIRLEELTLYRENLRPGEHATCHLRVRSIAHRQFVADMDIVDGDGRLWMRIRGWEDWRFHWPRSFYDFWRFPREGIASDAMEMTLPDATRHVEIRRMAAEGELRAALWEKLWAYLICSRRELAEFLSMPEGMRRTEWIVGRSAVKDAVRAWIEREAGLKLYPADVEIEHDEAGRPVASGRWQSMVGMTPQVSVAHKGRVAIAAAAEGPVGVDWEAIASRGAGFAEAAFSAAERTILAHDSEVSDEWLTRAWAAKEAAGKAWGVGLSGDPKSSRVLSVDRTCGTVEISGASTNGDERRLMVQTARDGGFVVALALMEQTEHARSSVGS